MCVGFSTLMSYTDTNEENLSSFIKLLDSALQHEVALQPPPTLHYRVTHVYMYIDMYVSV